MRCCLRYMLFLMVLSCVCGVRGQVFSSQELPDSIWHFMQGRSYPENCSIPREDLRFLQLSHYGFDKKEYLGQMVCNRLIAEDMIYIFRKLYEARYPIARMRLIDEYDACDFESMADNNTSCFCYRTVAGSKQLSKHSMGMAVDINPLYNPCFYVRSGKVLPSEGKDFVHNRELRKDIPGMIDKNDLCYRLFTSRGFRWGGNWRSLKDYQHFEK